MSVLLLHGSAAAIPLADGSMRSIVLDEDEAIALRYRFPIDLDCASRLPKIAKRTEVALPHLAVRVHARIAGPAQTEQVVLRMVALVVVGMVDVQSHSKFSFWNTAESADVAIAISDVGLERPTESGRILALCETTAPPRISFTGYRFSDAGTPRWVGSEQKTARARFGAALVGPAASDSIRVFRADCASAQFEFWLTALHGRHLGSVRFRPLIRQCLSSCTHRAVVAALDPSIDWTRAVSALPEARVLRPPFGAATFGAERVGGKPRRRPCDGATAERTRTNGRHIRMTDGAHRASIHRLRAVGIDASAMYLHEIADKRTRGVQVELGVEG